MNLIPNIDANAKQKIILALPDGTSSATLELEFMDNLNAWYMSIASGSFVLKQRRVYNSGNMLHQWHKIIPFGLACVSADGLDPYNINDFVSGRSSLMLLSQDEAKAYSDYLQEGV